MIECVIFDCDGTLVDSEYLCHLGLEIKFREYGVSISARDSLQRFRGWKLNRILDHFASEHSITLSEDFIGTYRSIVGDLFEKELVSCDGVKEMLPSISLPKCVASNGPRKKIDHALSITGIAHHFDENIFSSYDVGSWKPDPGLFLHAAKAMGFQPDRCAVVEDSLVGISAAKAAGMSAVLYDPQGTHGEVDGVRRIRHMRELPEAVAGN